MIRLLIADDEKLEREALAELVQRRFEREVVLEMAENGRKAADTAVLWNADLILMDIEMPGMSGLDAARAVLAQRPSCRVIFVTAYSLFQYAHEAVHLGACDYLLKPVDPDELEASVRRAIRQIQTERKLEELAAAQPQPQPEPPAAGEEAEESPEEGENSQAALIMAHVRRYLEDNYMFDLSLDSVGEILHISPAYLSRFGRDRYVKTCRVPCSGPSDQGVRVDSRGGREGSRRGGTCSRVYCCREQHHHAAAVVAAQPPEGCLRRERQCRGHHAADCDSPQRPKRRILPPRQTAGLRRRPDRPQRTQPEGERPAQGTDGGELDNAEIGEFIDIKRECAERGHQKRRGRLRCQLAQLLGLGHSETSRIVDDMLCRGEHCSPAGALRRRKLPRVVEDADPYTVGADSISARALFLCRTRPRANDVRPYRCCPILPRAHDFFNHSPQVLQD